MLRHHIKLISVTFLIAIGFCCCLTVSPDTRPKSYGYYRLPTSLKPELYTLKIMTKLEDPSNLMFAGEVDLLFKVLSDTDNITLHVQNLTIDEKRTELKKYNDSSTLYCIKDSTILEEHDYYIISLCQALQKDEMYTLTLAFKAPLNHRLHGYYRSSYMDKLTNRTKWLSITQFEPAYARSAFPCFDEPNYKAKFKIWLGHHNALTALSNMPLERQEVIAELPGYVWSIFEESVPMSTYLVAYSVNDFAYKSSGDNRVMFRTWSRPEAMNQCDYAAEIGPKLLMFYENRFGIKFPLKKLDQIAIPDFEAGAMENWGLITYRETTLLFAPNVSSESNRERIATVIAHELAHQWFGNLVTMKWWSDLWLNEGFATYMSNLGVDFLNPDWELLNEDAMDNILGVFKYDAHINSHPISQPIEATQQINERFDTISYKKGSAVLRMLHMILGEEAFFEGIRHYLMINMFNNAEQDDLWNAFTDRAHLYKRIEPGYDMKTIMDSWTLQVGYPLVKVIRNYDTATVEISQQRFLLNNSQSVDDNEKCWWTPLSFTTATKKDFATNNTLHWLECKEGKKNIKISLENLANKGEWILFNVQISGLYRVIYDENNWILLNRTLNSNKYNDIHVLNRAQLIEDALSLAWGGYMDYNTPLDMLQYLKQENKYLPWYTALQGLANVDRLLKNFPTPYGFFSKFLIDIILPVYNSLDGLNNTIKATEISQVKLKHKMLMAKWACYLKVNDCVQTAVKYFQEWKQSSVNRIPVDSRVIVYCTAIKHGDRSDWEFLWQRLQESNVATERRSLIQALSCSRNSTLLKAYIDLIFDENKYIRKQDSAAAFGAVVRNEVSFPTARDYLIEHIDQLHEFYGPTSQDLTSLLSSVAGQIINMEDLNLIQSLLARKRDFFKEYQKSVSNALETIQLNIGWINRNTDILRMYLVKRTSND